MGNNTHSFATVADLLYASENLIPVNLCADGKNIHDDQLAQALKILERFGWKVMVGRNNLSKFKYLQMPNHLRNDQELNSLLPILEVENHISFDYIIWDLRDRGRDLTIWTRLICAHCQVFVWAKEMNKL